MSLTSVGTRTITDPAGTPLVGVVVIARLRPVNSAIRIDDFTECTGEIRAVTNGSGVYTVTLERNGNLTPANTYWEIEERIPRINGGTKIWAVVSGAANFNIGTAGIVSVPHFQDSIALTKESGDLAYGIGYAATLGDLPAVTVTGRVYFVDSDNSLRRFNGATWDQTSGAPAPGSIAASSVMNTPAGNIAATDVQAALNELDTEKAPKASPTFTGTVTLPGAPGGANEAANKSYVDGLVTPDATGAVKGKVQLAGDLGGTAASPTVIGLTAKAPINNPTFTGTVTLAADPSLALQAATKQYVDTTAAAGTPDADATTKGKVQLTNDLGGTAALPTTPNAATNKGGLKEIISTIAASGAAQTINLANGNVHDITLTANCTFTFSGSTASRACSFNLILRQDGTGGRTVTWPASVSWLPGVAPTINAGANAVTNIFFMTVDNGTTWFGFNKSFAVDAAVGVGSLRTLGTGAQQAAAGNDSRFAAAITKIYPTFSKGGVLTVGAGTFRYYVEGNYTIVSVRVSVGTAPTGAAILVDVNKNGTTIFTTQANRPSIAISGNTATSGTINVNTLASGDYLTIDVDQIGSTVAGSDLVVEIGLQNT